MRQKRLGCGRECAQQKRILKKEKYRNRTEYRRKKNIETEQNIEREILNQNSEARIQCRTLQIENREDRRVWNRIAGLERQCRIQSNKLRIQKKEDPESRIERNIESREDGQESVE